MKKALLVCNGSIKDYDYYKGLFDNSYVIGVDGGIGHLRKFCIDPHVIIGDFDSSTNVDLQFYQNKQIKIIKYQKEKDKTDTHLAVEMAMAMNFREILIIGGLGTRFDHSLANVHLLKYIKDSGAEGRIINEQNEIRIITDCIKIKKSKKVNISLLALTDKVTGINSEGLYYPLENRTLKLGETIGISNKFLVNEIKISIASGALIVIESND